ncbi:MAG: hypothetical protein OQL20_05720 [Sedimenticola sp.]|nr:hypothetical protein [Sedimenticola sp.]
MRKSDQFFILLFSLIVLFVVSIVDTSQHDQEEITRLDRTRALVSQLGLSDPALFTEARYTRHLSQADLHSAFQDHPMAMEHFPSGSLLLPPQPGLK